MRKAILPLLGMLLAGGCGGGGLNGDYGGPNCIYQKVSFKSGGKMSFSVFGMEMPGTYSVEGDKVVVQSPDGRGLVFTRKGDTLDGGMAGRCIKL